MTQGNTIRDARAAKRMSQAMLAAAAGISAKTVVRAEADAPCPERR